MENTGIQNIINKSDVYFFTKDDWNKMTYQNTEKDIYRVDIDFSYSAGIVGFSHELSVFCHYDDKKFDFISASELASEVINYSKNDYEYLQERFPSIEEVITKSILRYENIQSMKKEHSNNQSLSKNNDKQETEDKKKLKHNKDNYRSR